MERSLVDLDHHRIGIDAEIVDQRLGDVAHHACLLLVGAAGSHADGDLRHLLLPFVAVMAERPFGSLLSNRTWISGTRPGMTSRANGYPHFTSWRARIFRTSATRSASATSVCASACRFRYSSRSLMSVSPAPRMRSLICTLPPAFSSEPCTTAQGALRRSAYFICWPSECLGLPR